MADYQYKFAIFLSRASDFTADPLRSNRAYLSVEIECVPNRRCQQILLIRKKESDLAPQCRNRDRDDVIDADDGIFLEPVTHTYGNFGRETANCLGDRRNGDSGQVRPHKFPSQD